MSEFLFCAPDYDQTCADVLRAIEPWYPCREGRDYLSSRGNGSWRTAWRECRNGPHMLWLLEEAESRRPDHDLRMAIRRAGISCAATALQYTTDPRVEEALVVAWRWTVGDATEEERSAAESAAWSAAGSAAWSAAGSEMADIVRDHFPEPPVIGDDGDGQARGGGA